MFRTVDIRNRCIIFVYCKIEYWISIFPGLTLRDSRDAGREWTVNCVTLNILEQWRYLGSGWHADAAVHTIHHRLSRTARTLIILLQNFRLILSISFIYTSIRCLNRGTGGEGEVSHSSRDAVTPPSSTDCPWSEWQCLLTRVEHSCHTNPTLMPRFTSNFKTKKNVMKHRYLSEIWIAF